MNKDPFSEVIDNLSVLMMLFQNIVWVHFLYFVYIKYWLGIIHNNMNIHCQCSLIVIILQRIIFPSVNLVASVNAHLHELYTRVHMNCS